MASTTVQRRHLLPRFLAFFSILLLIGGMVFAVTSIETTEAAPIGPSNFVTGFRAVITLLVLVSALFVILSRKYGGSDRKWAYGAIAAIIAFWLTGAAY
jgi:uncharacterized membrane protein